MPLLVTIACSTIKAAPQKTILACSTSDTWPTVFAKGPRKDSLRSSGESDATKVSLNINAANVAKGLTRRHTNEEGELKIRFLQVLAYVRITRNQRVSWWEEKKVRAMSGSAANFCPV